MSIIDFISMALFIATIIYISLKQIETFKIKLLVSIPFIILIFLFSRSFVLLPIYIYSLIAATYLYTIFFYIPFAIDFILILISSLDHMATLKLLLISISVPMLMSMFLDKNMKKYGLENEEHKGKDIKRESYRDYFQIGTGIITILVFVFFGHFGKVIILYSVLLIYLLAIYCICIRITELLILYTEWKGKTQSLALVQCILHQVFACYGFYRFHQGALCGGIPYNGWGFPCNNNRYEAENPKACV